METFFIHVYFISIINISFTSCIISARQCFISDACADHRTNDRPTLVLIIVPNLSRFVLFGFCLVDGPRSFEKNFRASEDRRRSHRCWCAESGGQKKTTKMKQMF